MANLKKQLRIIIAGGGTGGHIFPAIAIANAIKAQRPHTEFLFVGAKGKMEMEKVPQAGYKITSIDIAGFNRSSLLKNIGLPFKLLKSYFQVRGIVADFMPDAVIGVGGYSSYPVLRFAQSKNIPVFIHESNSFAGKANQWLGKKATKVFTATTGMENFFPADKIIISGNPVRRNIAETVITRAEGLAFFKQEENKPTVFVTGGSLGAKGINEAIADGLDQLLQSNTQLIWQTGKPFAATAKKLCEGKDGVWTNDFIMQMAYAYAAADVVVSRAGAMAIAELCVVKKPAVLVPFPFAAEDHQTVNAQDLVNKNAALLIKDADAKQKLVPALLQLLSNKEQQQQLKQNIAALAVTNADEIIATAILKEIEQ